MLSLVQASRLRKGAGEKLPDVWRVLGNSGIHIRRGQLHLCSAAPGVGKSAVWLRYAITAGVPTLYLSMDSDERTTTIRAGQMITGFNADKAESAMADTEFRDTILTGLNHIRFSFRSGINTMEVMMIVAAYAEAHGAFPHLIVVDNIGNIAFEGDEFGELRRIMADLHWLCRWTQSAVVALHHVTGNFDDGTTPVPLSGIQGKVSKMPELILTLSRGQDTIYVSPVKNRSGKADPSGQWRLPLAAALDTMTITDRELVAA